MLASSSSNFLVPDGTFVAEFIAFLIILGIIAKWILPPSEQGDAGAPGGDPHRRWRRPRRPATEADETRAQRQGILDEARQQAREIVAQANRTAEQVRADGRGAGPAGVRAAGGERRGRDRRWPASVPSTR